MRDRYKKRKIRTVQSFLRMKGKFRIEISGYPKQVEDLARQGETDESILEEAMDWFLRLREPTRAAGDEQEFGRWLDVSPSHREAWP